MSQRIEQFLILIYGVDIQGEPVDKTTKILTAINLGSELLLNAATFAGSLSQFTSRSSTPAQLRLGTKLPENQAGGGFMNALKPENAVGDRSTKRRLKK